MSSEPSFLLNLLYHVHPQLVIAGASETGLSCLEHLLLQPNTRFTSLTLLAPGGVRTDGVASQFTADRVARLGLHASVSTVDSHLVALDAQQQVLMLADGGHLPYDILAVTTGLQVCCGVV
jgi:NADH dehydrogenase FAD-containing subunit